MRLVTDAMMTPRIFLRRVIQIRVEEVDKELLVNNFFFHLDHYDNIDEIFCNL